MSALNVGRQKHVLVLGAGFSRYAGFPLQTELLNRFVGLSLLDAPVKTIEIFAQTLERVTTFLLHFSQGELALPLEDVFTLLDQTIARRETCVGLPWRDLDDTREALKRALLFSIHHASRNVPDDRRMLYSKFAAWLCAQRVEAGIDGDPISLISLNWDSLVEDSIYGFIRQSGLVGKVDVDYCCYTNSLTPATPHTPSTQQKAKGIFNIKLLKLHGSANWLRCPTCNRIFTAVGCSESVWEIYVNARECPKCVAPKLSLAPYLVTPTYLKVFDDSHIQSIWQNAYVELSEAAKITFIGYSLPAADYHVRTLLRRAIRADTEVEVILAPSDEPNRRVPKRFRTELSGHRYSSFFSNHRTKLQYVGAEGFFYREAGALRESTVGKRLRRRIQSLRRAAASIL